MAAVIRELESASPEVLWTLIDAYHVRAHDGQSIRNEKPLDFILTWLKPDSRAPVIDDPLLAIQTGRRFNPETSRAQETVDEIVNERVPISAAMTSDFANWPMQPFWPVDSPNKYDPWELLQGYLRTADRASYFFELTGEPASNFLNETERIFYLTRGYGRPNKYISPTDLRLREIFMSAAPTALIALSDLLGICPTLQDPEYILAQLSDLDLRSIDTFHRVTVQRLTECLEQARLCPETSSPLGSYRSPGSFDDVCTLGSCSRSTTGLEDCNPDRLRCFTSFLNSIGVLPIFEYDPSLNVFVSNLSQLGSYREVIPDKKWSYDEVKNMPDSYVTGIISLLPDQELLRIEVPSRGRFADTVSTARLSDRLRDNLVDGASRFLTQKQYFLLPDNRIGYGRRVDDELEEMSRDELEASILKYEALIDPYEHAMSPEMAEALLGSNSNEKIRQIIYKTRALAVENEGFMNELTPQQRGTLIGGFERLVRTGIDSEALEELVRSQGPFALKLLLRAADGSPVAVQFEDYFRNWSPTLREIIKKTLQYYVQVLST